MDLHKFKVHFLIFSIGTAIVVVILSYLFSDRFAMQVEAQLFTPFGGPIVNVDYKCCYGQIVTIFDYANGGLTEVMYYPGISRLHEEYQIFFPGPNTVGDYFPFGICIHGGSCDRQDYTDGTIRKTGTSSI